MRTCRSPRFFRVFVLLLLAATLSACGRSESYRYSLTVVMDTPSGQRSATSVVEKTIFEARMLGIGSVVGIGHSTKGEATYLDLGPGFQPLVILLASHFNQRDKIWADGPSELFIRKCPNLKKQDGFAFTVAVKTCSKPISLTPNDLPTMLTFANPADQNSAEVVFPLRMADALGEGVKFRSATLRVTDANVTGGLKKHLPWATGSGTISVRPAIRDENGNSIQDSAANAFAEGRTFGITYFLGKGMW